MQTFRSAIVMSALPPKATRAAQQWAQEDCKWYARQFRRALECDMPKTTTASS